MGHKIQRDAKDLSPLRKVVDLDSSCPVDTESSEAVGSEAAPDHAQQGHTQRGPCGKHTWQGMCGRAHTGGHVRQGHTQEGTRRRAHIALVPPDLESLMAGTALGSGSRVKASWDGLLRVLLCPRPRAGRQDTPPDAAVPSCPSRPRAAGCPQS